MLREFVISETKHPELCEQLSRLYRSFYLWLDEAKILDSTLYIPALSPAHGLDKLLRLLEGDDTLWLEFLDKDRVDKVSTAAVKEWDKLHFRYYLLIGSEAS